VNGKERMLDNRELTTKVLELEKRLVDLERKKPMGRSEDDKVPRKAHGTG